MTTFRVLLAAHRPTDPSEATLVLAAAAAFNGLKADGAVMPEAVAPRPPTLRQIAVELGLHIGAVRRGVRHLIAADSIRVDGDGLGLPSAVTVLVTSETLRDRWGQRAAVIRLTSDARERGMRSEALLITGLVAGQLDDRGRLCLGRRLLSERTGLKRWTLDRALAAAVLAGAIHRWVAPLGGGRLCLAIGPARTAKRDDSQSAKREGSKPVGGLRLVATRERLAPQSANIERCEPRAPIARSAKRNSDSDRNRPDTPEQGVSRPAQPGASDRRESAPSCVRETPIADLTTALLKTRYRSESGQGNAIRRRAAIQEEARQLVLTGLRAEHVPELARLAAEQTSGDSGALLSHWFDGNLWREVLDADAARRKEADLASRTAAFRSVAGERAEEGREPRVAAALGDSVLRAVGGGCP